MNFKVDGHIHVGLDAVPDRDTIVWRMHVFARDHSSSVDLSLGLLRCSASAYSQLIRGWGSHGRRRRWNVAGSQFMSAWAGYMMIEWSQPRQGAPKGFKEPWKPGLLPAAMDRRVRK